jgi:hypothetical protein
MITKVRSRYNLPADDVFSDKMVKSRKAVASNVFVSLEGKFLPANFFHTNIHPYKYTISLPSIIIIRL